MAHPSNITINVSDSAHMVCVAYGDPLPVLTWQREDGMDLPPNTTITQAVRVVEDTRFVVSILEMCDLNTSSFISSSATITCSCAASNNVTYGVAMETKSFTIHVQGMVGYHLQSFNCWLGLLFFVSNLTFSLHSNLGYPISPPGSHDLVAIVGEENYTISFNTSEASPPISVGDITWMFVTADGIEDGSVFSNGVFSSGGASFTIGRVEFHHEGMYVFTASNGAAGNTRESISMDVQGNEC